jgi:hypothetical protein
LKPKEHAYQSFSAEFFTHLWVQAEMEAAGMRPDVVTYTALMALVVKTGPYRGRSSPAQR